MLRERVIEAVGRVPLCGAALRWYAGRYEENSVVRVRSGCAAGYLWRRRHCYVNGYWIGHYELPIQQALRRELRPADIFFDVGAHAGFFTLVASHLIGQHGTCIAFDPSPENCENIREQLALNDVENVRIVQKAISDNVGQEWFAASLPGSPMGHLGMRTNAKSGAEVPTITLDKAAEEFLSPTFIKMDIEGAEGKALAGAGRLLRERRTKWLIELHGADCERETRQVLTGAGYAFYHLTGEPIASENVLPKHFLAKPGPL